MAEPDDMILPMLREMRTEIAAGRAENSARFDVMDRRLKRLEEAQVGFRHAMVADTLLSRLVTGEFEERIEAIERRLGIPERPR